MRLRHLAPSLSWSLQCPPRLRGCQAFARPMRARSREASPALFDARIGRLRRALAAGEPLPESEIDEEVIAA